MNTELELFPVERYVLEALSGGAKILDEIVFQTGLQQEILEQILKRMVEKNYINYFDFTWSIDQTFMLKLGQLKGLNLQTEVTELMEGAVASYFREKGPESNLKLKKLWLDKSDATALGKHFLNLETFVNYLDEKQKEKLGKSKIAERVMIYWGTSNYQQSVFQTLKSMV